MFNLYNEGCLVLWEGRAELTRGELAALLVILDNLDSVRVVELNLEVDVR
jgi:hypothetical protein